VARVEGEPPEPCEAPLAIMDCDFPTPLESALMVGPKKGQASGLRRLARKNHRSESVEVADPRDDASTAVPESTVKDVTHMSFGDGLTSAGHSALDSITGADLSKFAGVTAYEAKDQELAAILDIDRAIWLGACTTSLTAPL